MELSHQSIETVAAQAEGFEMIAQSSLSAIPRNDEPFPSVPLT
jgi:hypothetical protein